MTDEIEEKRAKEKRLKEKHPTLFKLLHEPRTQGVPMWSIQRGFETHLGWFPLIESLCEKIQGELDKLEDNSEFYVVQIKEKFGGLRFYMNKSTDAINELITQAELEADTTCEKCGDPGTIENIGNWVNCFCEKHKQERKEQVQQREKEINERSKKN